LRHPPTSIGNRVPARKVSRTPLTECEMRPVGRVWGLPAAAAAPHSPENRLTAHCTLFIAVERAFDCNQHEMYRVINPYYPLLIANCFRLRYESLEVAQRAPCRPWPTPKGAIVPCSVCAVFCLASCPCFLGQPDPDRDATKGKSKVRLFGFASRVSLTSHRLEPTARLADGEGKGWRSDDTFLTLVSPGWAARTNIPDEPVNSHRNIRKRCETKKPVDLPRPSAPSWPAWMLLDWLPPVISA
jgi:hypothetical protein